MAVGRQYASEISTVLGEQGPCDGQIQTVSSGPWQGATGLGEATTGMRKMSKTKLHCQEGQCLDCELPRSQTGRDQSDPGQDRGPVLCSRPRIRDVEQWLHMMEPKQKRGLRGASALGGVSGGGSRLHLPSGPSRKRYQPHGRLLPPPVCSHPLYSLLAALILFLLLAMMTAFFLLPSIIQECNWHRKNIFLPFHFTLTYVNGPPPT
ncbi:uncharacterized protein LOC127586457 [Pristis pectinata]|uniref:uncharacterized protein LOC127586457 n=1 Tax=Pristis pectinata TaxID=685728 RepID=UPI00223E78FB|nr:uncharacterized protein LOC127586457 [Pristis pectinata]